MVVDTSILTAVFFNEAQAPWALDQLQRHRGELRMSTVNLAEVLILCEDRYSHSCSPSCASRSSAPRSASSRPRQTTR